MFAIPLEGTDAREQLGDLRHVAEVLSPANRLKLPTFSEALRRGRRTLAETKGAKRVTLICFGNCNIQSQHGRIILLSVGPRGGWRKVWDFGAA